METGLTRTWFWSRVSNPVIICIEKDFPWLSYTSVTNLWCLSEKHPPPVYILSNTMYLSTPVRESSFNMIKGGWRYWGGVGAPKIFGPPKGGSVNNVGLRGGLRKFVYFNTNRKGGGLRRQAAFSFAVLWIIVCNCKKLNRYRGGLLKFQASSFNIFIPPPPVILNELSLKRKKLINYLLYRNVICLFVPSCIWTGHQAFSSDWFYSVRFDSFVWSSWTALSSPGGNYYLF